jgi:hypothetical protein
MSARDPDSGAGDRNRTCVFLLTRQVHYHYTTPAYRAEGRA